MMPRVLEEAWLAYSKVLPADAGPVQVEETRRAFFAGAFSLFRRIVGTLEPGTEATEADVGFLDAIDAELTEWAVREASRLGTVQS
jgi:hypothetical protein